MCCTFISHQNLAKKIAHPLRPRVTNWSFEIKAKWRTETQGKYPLWASHPWPLKSSRYIPSGLLSYLSLQVSSMVLASYGQSLTVPWLLCGTTWLPAQVRPLYLQWCRTRPNASQNIPIYIYMHVYRSIKVYKSMPIDAIKFIYVFETCICIQMHFHIAEYGHTYAYM